MRNRLFQTRMQLLALAAILLLALLPTFGRLAQAGQGVAATAWTQMCTVAGMKQVRLPAWADSAAGQPQPQDPAPGHAGMDCDYCPLLAALTAAVVALVLALLGFAPPPLPLRRALPRRDTFHPTGLGSRGPPTSFEIAL